jgi:hypothetical protein
MGGFTVIAEGKRIEDIDKKKLNENTEIYRVSQKKHIIF